MATEPAKNDARGQSPVAPNYQSPTSEASDPLTLLRRRLQNLGSGPLVAEVASAVTDTACEIAGAERAFIAGGESKGGRLLGPVWQTRTGSVFSPFAVLFLVPEAIRGLWRLRQSRPQEGDSDASTPHSEPAIVSTNRRIRLEQPAQADEQRTTIAFPIAVADTGYLWLRGDTIGKEISGSAWSLDDTRAIAGDLDDKGVVDLRPRAFGRLDKATAGSFPTSPTLYLQGLTRSVESARTALETLANEAGRILTDLANAAEMQRAILPRSGVSGRFFDAYSAMVPCRTIGGDSFEYVWLSGGRFGFGVCDVAGKGAPAALLSGVVQGIFYAESRRGRGPAKTLRRVNSGLMRRAIDSRFATMFYGILSEDGLLTYCNAGHNPPFLVGSSVRRLETGGLILGAFKGATFQEETVQLNPGDLLVVFSDGVTEAVNTDGVEFGEERLLACVTGHRNQAPASLLRCVLDTVQEFTGSAPQNDDRTALILRYRGLGALQVV